MGAYRGALAAASGAACSGAESNWPRLLVAVLDGEETDAATGATDRHFLDLVASATAIRPDAGASISAIVRGDQVLMAHHDTQIQADDHVILFIADRRQIDEVERLFEVGASFA